MATTKDITGIIAEELTAINPEFVIQEEEVDGVKKAYITGRFIRSDFVSSNGILYPAEIVDAFVNQINSNQPPLKTMLTNHFAPDKTLAIVGKVVSAWKDAAGDGFFKGLLADTVAAEEIKKLVRGTFLENISLRARPIRVKEEKHNGKDVLAVKDAEILGIDFTPMPGIAGASIDALTYEELLKEVTDMNIEELKTQLSELKESLNARDSQIASLQGELATAKNDIKDKEKAISTMEEEKTALSAKVAELTEEVQSKTTALKESEDKVSAFVSNLIQEAKTEALAKFEAFKDKKIYTFIEGAINGVTVESTTEFSSVLEEARAKLSGIVTNFTEMLEELTPSGDIPPVSGDTNDTGDTGSTTVTEQELGATAEPVLPKGTKDKSSATSVSNPAMKDILESIKQHTGVEIAPEDLG